MYNYLSLSHTDRQQLHSAIVQQREEAEEEAEEEEEERESSRKETANVVILA